mmetsp:Transcript_13398/g.39484  ORF Transcript_13398/g.39484 Transcript_13398/m.39484 type:complete len:233 (+) Transcript_13398:154-852(+)
MRERPPADAPAPSARAATTDFEHIFGAGRAAQASRGTRFDAVQSPLRRCEARRDHSSRSPAPARVDSARGACSASPHKLSSPRWAVRTRSERSEACRQAPLRLRCSNHSSDPPPQPSGSGAGAGALSSALLRLGCLGSPLSRDLLPEAPSRSRILLRTSPRLGRCRCSEARSRSCCWAAMMGTMSAALASARCMLALRREANSVSNCLVMSSTAFSRNSRDPKPPVPDRGTA